VPRLRARMGGAAKGRAGRGRGGGDTGRGGGQASLDGDVLQGDLKAERAGADHLAAGEPALLDPRLRHSGGHDDRGQSDDEPSPRRRLAGPPALRSLALYARGREGAQPLRLRAVRGGGSQVPGDALRPAAGEDLRRLSASQAAAGDGGEFTADLVSLA